jgi:hypothetical protein
MGNHGVDEETAHAERQWVYEARILHQTWAVIQAAFTERFGRHVAVNTLQRRYQARLDEIRAEAGDVKMNDRRQVHRDRLDVLARFWLGMTGDRMTVVDPETGADIEVMRPFAQKANAGIQYRLVLKDLATLDGFEAPAKAELTVTHTVEANPLVAAMIAESQKRIGQRKAGHHGKSKKGKSNQGEDRD